MVLDIPRAQDRIGQREGNVIPASSVCVCLCLLTDCPSVAAADEMHDGSESEDDDAFNSVQKLVDDSGDIGEQADPRVRNPRQSKRNIAVEF